MTASEVFPGPERSPLDGHLVAHPPTAGIDNAAALDDSIPETHVKVLAGRRRLAKLHETADNTLSLVGGEADREQVPPPGTEPPAAARSARCSIACGADLGTVVVTVHGELDGPGAAHLGAILGDLVEFEGNRHVIVDLGQATAGSPAGVAMFATAAEASYNHGRALTLTNLPAALGEALQRHGLKEIVSGPTPATPGLR